MSTRAVEEQIVPTLTPGQVRRSLRINIVAGALGMVWAACVFGMPMPLFLETIGASGVLIGLGTTLMQLAMVVQVPGALFAERLQTRKPFWAIVSFLHRLLWIVPAVLPFVLPGRRELFPLLVLWTILLSSVLAHSGAACWQSWMAELIPDKGAGQFWGVRQSILTATNLAGLGLMGWILDHYNRDTAGGEADLTGFSIVFGLAAAFGMADIIVHLWVREPATVRRLPTVPVRELLRAPLRSKDFRHMTLAMGAWYFSVGLAGSFATVYLKRDLGITYSQLALLGITGSLGAVLSGFAIGYLVDRVGPRPLATILIAAGPVTAVAWFFVGPGVVHLPFLPEGIATLPQPVVLIGLVSIVSGAIYSGVILCQLRLTAILSPPEGRTIAMAVHWTLVGLAAMAGPLAGGVVMDWLTAHPPGFTLPTGAPAGFFQVLALLHMVSAWLVAVPLMQSVRSPEAELPVGTALTRIFVGNPLQAARNVWNIAALSISPTIRSRAEAARNLGESRTALAVSDIIEKLGDPALDVREEAVAALGRIGGSEAAAALLAKLGDPGTDLALPIIRALRHCATPAAAAVLLPMLDDREREIRIESARTLGALGDALACAPLRGMFASSGDNRIRSAAAIALGQLHDTTSAPALLDALLADTSRTLRETLALAIGNIVALRDAFYTVLIRESANHGSEIPRLRDRMLRAADRLDLPAPARESLAKALDQFSLAYESHDFSGCARELSILHSTLAASPNRGLLPSWKLDLVSRMLTALAAGSGDRSGRTLVAMLAIFTLAHALPARRKGQPGV